MTTQPPRRHEARRPPVRGRVSVIGIIGEILITGGVLVFLFLGWQLWLNDLVVGADQNKAGVALSHSWSAATPVHQAPTPEVSTP
ncbi:MAG: sortase, partial [Microbacteriaceae bacterium]|nr:sortase [Microbacteriaceae bacterium]